MGEEDRLSAIVVGGIVRHGGTKVAGGYGGGGTMELVKGMYVLHRTSFFAQDTMIGECREDGGSYNLLRFAIRFSYNLLRYERGLLGYFDEISDES